MSVCQSLQAHFSRHGGKYAHVAAFWGALGGAYLLLPALIGYVNPYALMAAGAVVGAALGIARFLKRPGAE